jgi:hypothetical protein
MKTIYVTFSVPHLFQEDEKFAVKCESMEQAKEVAQDANSLDGIKNIRLRKCGKPRNREIMSYDNYLEYEEWY